MESRFDQGRLLRSGVLLCCLLGAALVSMPRDAWALQAQPCSAGSPTAKVDTLSGRAAASVGLEGTLKIVACQKPPPPPSSPASHIKPASAPQSPPPCQPTSYTYRQLSAADQAAFETVMTDVGQTLNGFDVTPDGKLALRPPDPLPNVANPSLFLFKKVDNCGNWVGISWLPVTPAGPATPAKAALDTVYQLSAEVVAPALTLGINPANAGITGLESYFWLAGYDGKPIDKVTQTAGATIEIRATPTSYTWDFGDGTPAFTTTSIGQPYPQAASDIRHLYDVRSDWSPAAVNGFYQVKVTASLDVSFRVVAPGINLPAQGWTAFASLGYQPIRSTATANYKVDEVRSILKG